MTSADSPRRSSLGVLFLIVFLDIAGFSIIFPLFPSLLEHYLANEGPGSAVGRLVEWLQGFAGDDHNATVTLFGGVLGSIYAVMQFLFSPVWGGLSDRIGRRSTLFFTLAGTVVAHLLWVCADTFALLVISRLLAGAMAGNIATAAAAVADTSSGRDRAKGMGMIGVGIGLGFILGPALGGITNADSLSLLHAWPGGAAIGLNPFSTPALAAASLALLNMLWVATRFAETLPPERRGHGTATQTLRPFSRLHSLDFPGVARSHAIYFIYLTAFAAMEFTLTFLSVERLDYTVGDITWMFVYSGFLIALVQGGIVRRLVPKLGERKVALIGMVSLVPAFVIVGAAHSTGMLYGGLTLLSFGSGLAMPSLSALVSRYVPADRQGLAQGTLRSMGSLSRAIGPLVGGLLYFKLGSAAPYWVGAVVLLIPIAQSLGLPPIQEGAEPVG